MEQWTIRTIFLRSLTPIKQKNVRIVEKLNKTLFCAPNNLISSLFYSDYQATSLFYIPTKFFLYYTVYLATTVFTSYVLKNMFPSLIHLTALFIISCIKQLLSLFVYLLVLVIYKLHS